MIRKRLLMTVGLLGASVMLAAGATSLARGESGDIITDAQIAMIRTHCTDLQATLNRLHQSDILLRLNRGELYIAISSKLMTPFNQRVASNKLDGSELIKVTATYNTAFQTFYDDYKDYETSLATALTIDCQKQPTRFYDQVADARTKRLALHAASARMVSLAREYKTDFDKFQTTIIQSGAV